MKKGFTMIELIFVIVILGILASVAIPRLAATREDAEISATVANLRTLVNDATAYYTVKGDFGASTNGTKWNEITNVPLSNTDQAATGNAVYLKAGGQNCIGVQLVNKANTTPAHIVFTTTNTGGGVCKQVVESPPVKVYLDSTLPGETTKSKIAIGSSTSIYPPAKK